MRATSVTAFLLLSEVVLTGIMLGFGLALLASTVSITSVTEVNDDNYKPFIKLWGTTALYLLTVGIYLIATVVLLNTFIGFTRHKYEAVDNNGLEILECDLVAKLRERNQHSQLRRRSTVWLWVVAFNFIFVASQFLWPIPVYQYIYYGVVIGFKLLVIGAVVNLRRWSDISNCRKRSGVAVTKLPWVNGNRKGDNFVNVQVQK